MAAGGMHQKLDRFLTIASAFVAEQRSTTAADTCADMQATFADVAPLGIARRLSDAERQDPKMSKLLDLITLGVRHAKFEERRGSKQQPRSKPAAGAMVSEGKLTTTWDAAVQELLRDSTVQATLLGLQVCSPGGCCLPATTMETSLYPMGFSADQHPSLARTLRQLWLVATAETSLCL